MFIEVTLGILVAHRTLRLLTLPGIPEKVGPNSTKSSSLTPGFCSLYYSITSLTPMNGPRSRERKRSFRNVQSVDSTHLIRLT